MPQNYHALGYELTSNLRGYMHPLNDIGQDFVDFAKDAPGLVVDMGAAFGVATIPILKKHIPVLACDMERAHLDELNNRTSPSLRSYLKLQKGYFPKDFNFEEKSIGAILLSHILHFLSPIELEEAFDKLALWLAPQGKLFIACYSPYLANMKDYLPLYEARLAKGIRWPYWRLNNAHDYFSINGSHFENHEIPPTLNYLDLPLLTQALKSRGFSIEKAEYLDPDKNSIPLSARLDGREWCGVVGIKLA